MTTAVNEPRSTSTMVDLSQEIYQGMPVYPGHLNTVIWEYHSHEGTKGSFESDLSYATKGIILSDHGPTHVDSLSHFDPNSDATIDRMELPLFWGPALCLDISGAGPGEDVEPTVLEASLNASGQQLLRDDILLLRTGNWERNGGTEAYLSQYPGLSGASAEWLVERGVKAFGVDTPTPDNPTSRTYPVHLLCRREGLHHYENLGDLSQVVNRRFTFIGLPLRFRGGHGSPVRAVALLED
jgi:kynurenine formamidase